MATSRIASSQSMSRAHASLHLHSSPRQAARSSVPAVLKAAAALARQSKAQVHARPQQHSRRLRVRAESDAGSSGSSQEGSQPQSAPPPAWELAQRVSGDAAAMMMTGDSYSAGLILQKGLAEIQEQYPTDPSRALLHTQLWHLQHEAGQHEAALEQAKEAHELMKGYFGEESADAAFHGIRLGISLIATSGDIDEAQQLLVYGGSTAEHNLGVFWERLQELEAQGDPNAPELALQTKKLMVALGECNFYGAVGVVRKALMNADELEVAMPDLAEAFVGGTKQMAMALPPDHPTFATAMRELGRLIPDAAGRPTLQAELTEVQTKLQELLYFIKQMPESLKAEGVAGTVAGAGGEGAAPADAAEGDGDAYLP